MKVYVTILGSLFLIAEVKELDDKILLEKPLLLILDPINRGLGFADIGFTEIEIPKQQFIAVKINEELTNAYLAKRSNLIIANSTIIPQNPNSNPSILHN